ncbi:DUF4783 domain-containing protein [Flavisolibacter nicotianae]|uniref:DUF4783 domain-containing protein n=1 Tax=Flavisolibacter nicotianae TaxID=2364882 RepID=UPI000EB0DE41|nr:DUF4783 domain-containing protein [Flavisolibacter nicotianae]
MKKFYSLSLVILFFLAGHAGVTESGRTGAPVSEARTFSGIDDVINALRTGNASELAKYVDDNIEISLPSKSDSYSRSQAVVILQDFFSTNGVKNFDVKFKGENGGSQYCIGTLQTRSGNFRTTFLLANRNGKQLVKEIRFQSM